MVAALKKRGVPVGYFLFHGEQHGFRKAENIKRLSLSGERAVKEQTKGRGGLFLPPAKNCTGRGDAKERHSGAQKRRRHGLLTRADQLRAMGTFALLGHLPRVLELYSAL
jgi:hypothetical protein